MGLLDNLTKGNPFGDIMEEGAACDRVRARPR